MILLLLLLWTVVLMVVRRRTRRAAARPIVNWLRANRLLFSLAAGLLLGSLNAVVAESAWGLVLVVPVAAASWLAISTEQAPARRRTGW